jgi:hypothetical protein
MSSIVGKLINRLCYWVTNIASVIKTILIYAYIGWFFASPFLLFFSMLWFGKSNMTLFYIVLYSSFFYFGANLASPCFIIICIIEWIQERADLYKS